MKTIKTISIILLISSLIVLAVFFIFIANIDVSKSLPQVSQQASRALGRPVSFGRLGLGFSLRGITLDVSPLIIADDPGFTTQPFIKVDRVRISVDLKSLILQHQVHVTDILIQSPQIHLIRNADGILNIRSILNVSIGDVGKERLSALLKDNEAKYSDFIKQKISSLPSVSVEHGDVKVIIQDASISLIDQSPSFPVDIWLTNIGTTLNGFSLSKPFELSLDASFYSKDPNVHVNALVFLDLLKRTAQMNDLRLYMDLSQVKFDLLKGVSPHLSDRPYFKNIVGQVDLTLAHLEIGDLVDFKVNGDLHITGGAIKDFNITKTILSQTLGGFGWVEGNVVDSLNGPMKDILGAQDTVLEKAEIAFSIHDKTVFIDNSLIKTNMFEFKAQGSIDEGLNTDLQTMLHLSNDVSAALIDELGGLKVLCDDSDRIAIGASLKGVVPHLKYKPNKDFKKKSRKALIEEGGNILGVLFGGRHK